jgi:predicted aspartyl protease
MACAALLLLSSAGLCASTLHEGAPLFTRITQTTAIPAEVTGHGMFVSVMINGQGPFRMEIDTGCSYSIISPEVAAAVEAHGVESDSEDVLAVNGLGDSVQMPRVILDTLTIGSVQFEGVVAGVVPLQLQSKIDSRVLDGLLGYTLFTDLFFAMDFPGQQLVLSPDWPKNLPPVRAELPITEQSEVPTVKMLLQGKSFTAMIDTGANERLHLSPEQTASLIWKVEPRSGFLLAVAGEVGREHEGRLAGELDLGGVRQEEPVVGVSDGPTSIGTGLLHSFCLVFHEAEDKLWLCSTQSGLLASPPERSVGISMYAEAGGWRVAAIIPNSPAETAAIAVGDILTQIEGQPARNWTRDQVQAWIDSHASLTVHLSGSSGERDINLPVWSLVP